MKNKLVQRVGSKDYHGEYEVKGDNVSVTIDGETREAPIGNQGALYKARDVVRMIIRDHDQKAAA